MAAHAVMARVPVGDQILFELHDDCSPVDVAMSVGSDRIQHVATALGGLPQRILDKSPDRVWLEFDTPETGGQASPPGVFWGGGERLGVPHLDALAEQVIPFGQPDFLGVFEGRRGNFLRVCLPFQAQKLEAFALTHGLDQKTFAVFARAARQGQVRVSLDLNVDTGVGARIGLDIPVRTTADVARIDTVLASGILSKLDKIDQWPAASDRLHQVPEAHVRPDPVPGQDPVWVRRMNHVKLVSEAGTITSKLYLFLGLGWDHGPPR